jgi:hypothetical protein
MPKMAQNWNKRQVPSVYELLGGPTSVADVDDWVA